MDKKKKYNHKEIQDKWNKKWGDAKIYHPDIDSAKKPYYNLMMFPYPSAEGLHVGNMYAFTGADVYGRFMRLKGYDVFEPIGLDGFGIHSENYALKIGANPSDQAKISEKRFYGQLRMIGNAFDWSRTVETYKPNYYKWTQWLFIQLFKAGLAEKKKAEVNWCPSCKTVLADEQVLQKSKIKNQKSKIETEDTEERVGVCERCDTQVLKKELEQWFFKITKYSDRLLEGLDRIDWTEKVKIAQKNWIGKSEGALVKFKTENEEEIKVFTTRPDTLFGATFLVLSPQHPFVKSNIDKLDQNIKKYIDSPSKKSPTDLEKEKTGVFSGMYAINPVNEAKIPIWIADYVLMSYGTGAVMAVPAHDERDFEFAKKYELPVKYVLAKPDGAEKDLECYTNRGQILDSGEWSGWDSAFDFDKIISWLEEKGIGSKEIHYHLRDWLISRQRYWGAPIPMINCPKCGWQPVPEEDLPVVLPYIKNFKPLGTGVAPLTQDEEFVNVKCPNCSGLAKRETDVCDTFLDSSWYFLRYPSASSGQVPFEPELTKKWLPVNMYIGGAEHSVLHLLYSRFVTKVLFDQKLLDFDEPFTKFRAHGLLIKDGGKMSKSKGNVVNPDEYINKYGADTLRSYLMFLGPYDQGGDFRDSGIEGMERFLKRVRRFVESNLASKNQSNSKSANFSGDSKIEKSISRAIKGVGNDVENLRYNTALAKIMELLNDLSVSKDTIGLSHLKSLVIMLAPFAPYLAEELWEMLGGTDSVHRESWPEFNEAALKEEEYNIAVQIGGKLRGLIIISATDLNDQAKIESKAHGDKKIASYLEGLNIQKVIYVPGKILNFVVS